MEDDRIIIELTTDIVSAFVSNNLVSSAELPALITRVHSALEMVGAEPAPETPEQIKLTPAQIRKSITPDGIISFEDGKPYSTLKRHLSKRGLTIAEYKIKWGLPSDYPVTSPAYSAKRSEMARAVGLGRVAGMKAPPGKKPRKTKNVDAA